MEFSPRAALCTAAVLGGFVTLATTDLPFAFLGFEGAPRDGLLPMFRGQNALPSQDRDILRAVFAHEARRPGRVNVCLRLRPGGRTFEIEKRAIRALEQRLREEPGARSEIVAELDRLQAPARAWLLPSVESSSENPLPAQSRQLLGRAEARLVTGPRLSSGFEFTLDDSAVPEVFRSQGPGCSTLLFSAPAVAGEIAFVETRFRCGERCGEDWLYAVVRREERWEVAAMARLMPA